MSFRPTPRHIGEDGQNRKLVVIIPKQEWIMPEQQETECHDDESGKESANKVVRGIASSPSSSSFSILKQNRQGNDDDEDEDDADECLSTAGVPSVITRTLSSTPWARAAASNRAGGSSSGSYP